MLYVDSFCGCLSIFQDGLSVPQDAAERTPRFGRGIASGGEGVHGCRARRQTAAYVPFSVYTMVWSGEHLAFIVEEFIKMAGRR